MIDIDVSKCCCYENGKCLWTKRYSENNIVPDCEKVKDCYYKQLKRLEQENAELKGMIDSYELSENEANEIIAEVKAENEAYKNSILANLDLKITRRLEEVLEENDKLKEQKKDYCYDCDVAERMRSLVWYVTNGRMSYANYTYEAMTEVYEEVVEERIEPYREKLEKAENCLEEIEEIARTLGNQNDVKYRLDDNGIQDLFKVDDDLLTSEEIMRKHILKLIKQIKEGEE